MLLVVFFGEQFVPKQAITMGVDTIMKAKKVVLMAWGEGKSNIISRMAGMKDVINGSIKVAKPYVSEVNLN